MIPVNTPLFSGNEKKYLMECIDTGRISSEGPFVKKFEKDFSSYVNRRYGVAVANGSAALDIAVQALNISKGDEVIMPAFTIISPAASVVRQGAVPVLIDSCSDTWNMDVTQIEKKITKKTVAILVVHIYGFPVDMDPILEIAQKYKLKIIEDAAEMHGQTYKGKMCGSFGHLSIFSFYPNKHITTGEGGMLVTDDQSLAERCHALKNLCFIPEKRFVHHELGWNYRMTNLQAAIGIAQLEKIEMHLAKKRSVGKLYHKLLQDIDCIDLPLIKTSFAENIYWVFGIILNKKCKFSVDQIIEILAKNNIGTRPFFYPMHLQPVFKKMGFFKRERYPVAELLFKRGFYLPSGLGIKDEEINIVSSVLHKVLQ